MSQGNCVTDLANLKRSDQHGLLSLEMISVRKMKQTLIKKKRKTSPGKLLKDVLDTPVQICKRDIIPDSPPEGLRVTDRNMT